MKKKYQIKNRKIILSFVPSKTIKKGLIVSFRSSNYWIRGYWTRRYPYKNPIMTTDILKGQQEYDLPKYFRVKSIKRITLKTK